MQVAESLGHVILEWQSVPFDNSDLGESALETEALSQSLSSFLSPRVPDQRLSLSNMSFHEFTI
ncbi:hypothetical protein SEVIR_5G043950v4 [Setaria viridis]